jgi:hypothetical protein
VDTKNQGCFGMITLNLNEAASVVACIELYGKGAGAHVKAFFAAKERQGKAERNKREAAQETESGAMIEDSYRNG